MTASSLRLSFRESVVLFLLLFIQRRRYLFVDRVILFGRRTGQTQRAGVMVSVHLIVILGSHA